MKELDNLNQTISTSDNKSLFKDLTKNTDKLKSISFESSKTIPSPVFNQIPPISTQVKPASTVKQIQSNVVSTVSTQNSINNNSTTLEQIVDNKQEDIQSIQKSSNPIDSSNEISYETKESPEITKPVEKIEKSDSK